MCKCFYFDNQLKFISGDVLNLVFYHQPKFICGDELKLIYLIKLKTCKTPGVCIMDRVPNT